jgi:adenylate cyclase class 2
MFKTSLPKWSVFVYTAHMSTDVEIEIKLPLINAKEVEAALNNQAEFQYQSFQHDVYYNAPHRNFLEDSDNVNEWFRVRVAEGKAQINYKDFQPHDAKVKTHCIEYEAGVDSEDQLSKILQALNFVKLVDVKKTRKAWRYMDTEVSVDSVEGLGDFIEVEYKGKRMNIKAARHHLFEVLKTLGAQTGELDTRGYPYLMLEKLGLLS